MASYSAPDRRDWTAEDYRSGFDADRLPEEMLAPVLAGAYARGIADTLEMFGMPGVFLDCDGCVLLANQAAKPFLRGPLRVRSDHLVADEGRDNRALSELIAAAIAGPGVLRSVTLPHAGVTLHSLPVPARMSSGQLLRAVLLVEDGSTPLAVGLVRHLSANA